MSKRITVTVAGQAMTGKTTVMQIIERALRDAGLEPTVDYLPDGKPRSTVEDRVHTLAGREVLIREKHLAWDPKAT